MNNEQFYHERNRKNSFIRDNKKFDIEWDDELDAFSVYGIISGYTYGSFDTESKAKNYLNKLIKGEL